MTICACSLLLYLGRLRYLAHFECDRRALGLSEYGFDRLLVERHLAVFGVHRQIGIGFVADVLYKLYIEFKLYAVCTLAVRCRYFENDLRRLLLRSLLEDFALMLGRDLDLSDRLFRTVSVLFLRNLDVGRRLGGRRTRRTGGRYILDLFPSCAACRSIPLLGAFLLGLIVSVVEYNCVTIV